MSAAFTLEQIRLLCRTPKETLDRFLPDTIGAHPVRGQSAGGSHGSCVLEGHGVALCSVRFDDAQGSFSYRHELGAFANERREK